MVDNTEEATTDHVRRTVDNHQSHLVRHSEGTEGVVEIVRKSDGIFDIRLHDGSDSEATTIEGISKDKMISLMEEKL